MSIVFAVLALSFVFESASGCPVCDSSTADDVRAGLLSDFTASNALAVVLPFAVIGAGVAMLEWRSKNRRPPEKDHP